ncbi:MAG: hypothetical protein M9894_28815 [Planctomycetes bacterium]|nr:hypothetical protein [Planctomycetota bacterium]
MTLVKAGEGRHGLVVREVALDGGPLSEEAFVKEGQGSAFVSRPDVLVFVTTTERGLALLPAKVEQLIGRGFHHLALEAPGLKGLTPAGWEQVKAALAYTDQFAGWLALCGLAPAAREVVTASADRDGVAGLVRLVDDRDAAIAALRRLQQEGADPLLVDSGDDLGQSGDETSADDDWGDWGDAPAATSADSGRLPRVDVGELLVEADELGGLREQLLGALRRGKRHFTLRVHFPRQRPVAKEDVQALIAARQAVAKAGGLLVVAALQEDAKEEVRKWLRLAGEDGQFALVETADEAERLHRRHAAGEQVTSSAPSDAAFVVVARDDRAVVVRPAATRGAARVETTTAAGRVIRIGREGLAGLPARVKRLAGEGVHDVIADLGQFREVRGESFDPMPQAVDAARRAGARLVFAEVSREVRALLKILGVPEEALADSLDGAALLLAAQRPAFEELRLELDREALDAPPPLDPVSSIDLDEEPTLGIAPARAGAEQDASRRRAQELEAERDAARRQAQALEAERDAARRKAQTLEAERDAARRQAQELEAAARRVPELEEARARAERALEEQRGATQLDATRLEQRVATLERELEARRARVAELELALEQGDAQAEEARREAEARAEALAREAEALRERAQALEAGAGRLPELEQSLEARDARVAELEAALDAARVAAADADGVRQRLSALEAELAIREQRLEGLQADVERFQAAAPGGAPAGSDDAHRARLRELELENARILAEAEQEIQRLMKEQQLLREELESAGDMIERLGKELEFS